MMPPTVVPGTLYADWLRRRESLGAYRGEREPIIAIQLRVLDYLIERYRDDAAALLPAPPPLDSVYLNQRAIVVNHHRSLGMVAGVKSAAEAESRVTSIVARMYGDSRDKRPEINLERAAFADDPWFGWSEPDERSIKQYWLDNCFNLPAWFSRNPRGIRDAMLSMPYLPRAFVNQLYNRVARLDEEIEWAAELLAFCRNRIALGYIARAWRDRVAAHKCDSVSYKLREALVNWDRCVADTVRSMLSDESGEVRMAAAMLLAEIGELRDVGIFADLLAMPLLSDEEPAERLVLAEAMEKLAMRLREPRSVLV
jgi:hypothetical protein